MISEAPHNKGKEHLMQGVTSQFPSRRSAGTRSGPCCILSCCPPAGPYTLVELGDELRQVLHASDEVLDLPAADRTLIDET